MCPAIPKIGSTDDEAAQWEAEMIDIYKDCAIRHNVLIRWIEGESSAQGNSKSNPR